MEKLPDQTGSQILCPIPCSGAVGMGSMGSVEAIKFKKRVQFFNRKEIQEIFFYPSEEKFSIPEIEKYFYHWDGNFSIPVMEIFLS